MESLNKLGEYQIKLENRFFFKVVEVKPNTTMTIDFKKNKYKEPPGGFLQPRHGNIEIVSLTKDVLTFRVVGASTQGSNYVNVMLFGDTDLN